MVRIIQIVVLINYIVYLANTAWSPLNEIHDTALTGEV